MDRRREKVGGLPTESRILMDTCPWYEEGGEEEIFFASGGFLEVQPGEVTLLTDVAERADDIDSAAAERAKELAERELEDQKSEMDYSLATAQLAEAAARLKALQKLRKK